MDDNKIQTKSLNEQLLAIAETVDAMADSEIAITKAYVESLKDLRKDYDDEETKAGGVSVAPVVPTL